MNNLFLSKPPKVNNYSKFVDDMCKMVTRYSVSWVNTDDPCQLPRVI